MTKFGFLGVAVAVAAVALLAVDRPAGAETRFDGVTLRVGTWGGPWGDMQKKHIRPKLEALGAKVTLTPKQVTTCVDQTGIGFMFAQSFHPAMKFAGPLRPQIGIRNVFNILGPLTNPAGANCHVMGVANQEIGEKLAHALNRLGVRHAVVVNGADGLDDLTVTGESHIFEVMSGKVTERTVTPVDLGVSRHDESEIAGGTPEENAQVFRDVLAGTGSLAVRDLILVNAGAGLYVTGLASSIKIGAELAAKAIDSGDAAARVGAFVEATRRAS